MPKLTLSAIDHKLRSINEQLRQIMQSDDAQAIVIHTRIIAPMRDGKPQFVTSIRTRKTIFNHYEMATPLWPDDDTPRYSEPIEVR